MIVVDVGCMPQGPEESVRRLIERFHPDVLFGFDPFPGLAEGVSCVESTIVVQRRMAAWTYDGVVPLKVDGICTGVDPDGLQQTPCFNLISWMRALPQDGWTVLKLDAEGAEYPLLEALAVSGLDAALALVLVEWHEPALAHGLAASRPELRCPIEDW